MVAKGQKKYDSGDRMGALKMWEQALSRVCTWHSQLAKFQKVSNKLDSAFHRTPALKTGRQLCSIQLVCMLPLGTLSLHRLPYEVCCMPSMSESCASRSDLPVKDDQSTFCADAINCGLDFEDAMRSSDYVKLNSSPQVTLHACLHCSMLCGTSKSQP